MRLPTASYDQSSRNSGRLVNCYAEQSIAKAPVTVLGAPGITSVATLEGPGRGLGVLGGHLYALCADTLYRVDTGLSVGTVLGSDLVTFASTATELVTDNGYHFNGTTVSLIGDADKVPWSVVDYCDGRAVYVETGTGRFGATELNDLDAIDGLDFATAEGSPDDLVSLIVDHRQVVLFGKDSTELWWNSGASGFPFERMSNGFLELGAISRLGRTKADNSVFWLASDRTIRRLSGSTPVRVSQHGVEEALATYYLEDCHAYSFTWNGHIHVVFRFPTEDKTWVFDATTGEWYEREGYHRRAWDIVAAIHHNGRVYVQHKDGRVGYLDEVNTEFGEKILREITFPNIYSSQRRQFFTSFDAVLSTGKVAADVIPQLTLEVSHDGGNTWHALPVREFGRTGEYNQVVRWHRLGSGRDTVFRLSTDSDVPFVLTDAVLNATQGQM
jgi:hypothetical protein